LAIFSLSSGWLRPLINLISFAISADMVRKFGGGRRATGSPSFLCWRRRLLAGDRDCGAVTWAWRVPGAGGFRRCPHRRRGQYRSSRAERPLRAQFAGEQRTGCDRKRQLPHGGRKS
jgi:hypothetical protein